MPNIITTALMLSGTRANLNALRDAILQEVEDDFHITNTAYPVLVDNVVNHRDTTQDARWMDISPTMATLSFLEAWTPSPLVAKAITDLLAAHNISLVEYASIEEFVEKSKNPTIWETQDLIEKPMTDKNTAIFTMTGRFHVNPSISVKLETLFDQFEA